MAITTNPMNAITSMIKFKLVRLIISPTHVPMLFFLCA
jgi:hypothetical protein